MSPVTRHVVTNAARLARQVEARFLVVYADAIASDRDLADLFGEVGVPTILLTRSRTELTGPHTWVRLPGIPMSRAAQVRAALLVCLTRKILARGDRVLFVSGPEGSGSLDAMIVFEVGTESEVLSLAGSCPLAEDVAPEVFERVLTLATQLAVEGREGRPVGTLFVLGDTDRVLGQSRRLVLNPFQGHPEAERNILDPDLDETVKEFAAIDGAFVIRGDGVVLSAGTHLTPSAPHPPLPGGLGTRHAAAAGITVSTEAMAVCISQSTGTVSIFKDGHLVTSLPRAGNGIRMAG